jgi:hypothetical protein
MEIFTANEMNMKNYEEIIYNFYPDKSRMDLFFDKHRNMYEYRLYEMGRQIRGKFIST